jgi:hypothetical protein
MGCRGAGTRGVYSNRDEENDIKSRYSGRITDVRYTHLYTSMNTCSKHAKLSCILFFLLSALICGDGAVPPFSETWAFSAL